jgi:hypothetical protein
MSAQNMHLRIASVGVLLFILFGCSVNTKPDSQLYKLPSGKQVKITGMNKMDFANSDPALVLNYQTDIPIDDTVALRKEVDEIWRVFQRDVEAANLKGGVIRATHLEGTGLVKNGKGYGFVFVKREDGKWHCLEDDRK